MGAAAPGGLTAGVTKVTPHFTFRRKSVVLELQKLVQILPRCRDIAEALSVLEQAFVASIGLPVAIVSEAGNVLHHTPGFLPDDGDFEAARSAMDSGERIEYATADGLQFRYAVPLTTWSGAAGALQFASTRPVPRRMWPLIHSFANQTALTMIRSALAEEARHASFLCEADRFQKALLNAVAHNVRTPLASIIGVLSTLQENHAVLDPIVRDDLLDTARQEADRLNRLLGNLLDFSRIECGAVQVRADPCDVQDVIGAALEQLGAKARERPIEVLIDPALPLVRMDFALIVQVLVNILDNALKYSPSPTPIGIEAKAEHGQLEIRVSDQGEGIEAEDLDRVFEKFNRARRTGETGGIGLGLSICRGLIEAHRGAIWAERRSPSGAAVVFRLPIRQERDK
jgi:two-component system sensor histidine kinase KdpD